MEVDISNNKKINLTFVHKNNDIFTVSCGLEKVNTLVDSVLSVQEDRECIEIHETVNTSTPHNLTIKINIKRVQDIDSIVTFFARDVQDYIRCVVPPNLDVLNVEYTHMCEGCYMYIVVRGICMMHSDYLLFLETINLASAIAEINLKYESPFIINNEGEYIDEDESSVSSHRYLFRLPYLTYKEKLSSAVIPLSSSLLIEQGKEISSRIDSASDDPSNVLTIRGLESRRTIEGLGGVSPEAAPEITEYILRCSRWSGHSVTYLSKEINDDKIILYGPNGIYHAVKTSDQSISDDFLKENSFILRPSIPLSCGDHFLINKRMFLGQKIRIIDLECLKILIFAITQIEEQETQITIRTSRHIHITTMRMDDSDCVSSVYS